MTETARLVCLFCGGSLSATLEQRGHGYTAYEVPGPIECDRCDATWGPDGTPTSHPVGSEWWHGTDAP